MCRTDYEKLKVSIVISSFNYEKFLGSAIDSALSIEWDNKEVIVVDDGSTDNSRKIILSYAQRLISVFQDNSGRVAACNKGFELSDGEIVIFLDSDDVLHPRIVKEAIQLWSPEISKIQCQMSFIDGEGITFGKIFPSFKIKPTPSQIFRWFSRTSSYPTPVGSGNIYSRRFLEKIFPIDPTIWDSSDSCCLAAAPFLGSVETVKKPLVYYRVHGRNASLPTKIDPSFQRKEIIRSKQRFEYAIDLARSQNIFIEKNAIYNSISFATNRIVSYRLAKKLHPIENDSIVKILSDGLWAGFSPQGLSPSSCIIKVFYIMIVGLMPIRIVRKAVLWRFVPTSRTGVTSSIAHYVRRFQRGT